MRRKVRKRILQPTVTTVQLVPKHNNQNETKSNIKKTQISKLSFRTKALDPSKPMNIHIGEELPGLRGCSVINRAVPLLPTGMNKGEESEHHLQRALRKGAIIPTPEVFNVDQDIYERIYPEHFMITRQLVSNRNESDLGTRRIRKPSSCICHNHEEPRRFSTQYTSKQSCKKTSRKMTNHQKSKEQQNRIRKYA